MKIPFRWLKEYLPLTQSAKEVAEALTILGLEIETIDVIRPQFSGVLVGEILDVQTHPNADRLRIAHVSDGQEKLLIVCGAPNCRAGIKVALARIGAELPDQGDKKITIKKSSLRGIASCGMLCSAEELGISGLHLDGEIVELSHSLDTGMDLATLYEETIFDISVTPNLGHTLSLLGVARELSAYFELPLKFPELPLENRRAPFIDHQFQIEVAAEKLCPQYACLFMQGVEVGPSPDWLRHRLEYAGQKSINNLVDICNYVMLERGQPLHCFDADKISMNHLIIKEAEEEESLLCLDGVEREIPRGTLLIADPTHSLAIAGVIGGLNSAVSRTTKKIYIEAARFSSSSIRKTSKALNLRTESSYRFERQIDPMGLHMALNRAAALIQELCPGASLSSVVQHGDFTPPCHTIPCRIRRLNAFLGLRLNDFEVTALFERLRFIVHPGEEGVLLVIPPSFRNDIQIEEDLFEEVARLYGYHHIPRNQTKQINSSLPEDPIYYFNQILRTHWIGSGLQEVITCPLIHPSKAEETAEHALGRDAWISLIEPNSMDWSLLRPSLLPGLLEVARFNQARGTKRLALFEMGKIYFKQKEKAIERPMTGILLQGDTTPYHFQPKPRAVDFFDLKGLIENLFLTLKLPQPDFSPSHLHSFHPFRQAEILMQEVRVGALGEIHPHLLLRGDLHTPAYFAELDLLPLLHNLPQGLRCHGIPLFPGSQRDWTITLPLHLPIGLLFSIIRHAASPFLEKSTLIDLYQSPEIGPDHKNVTLRFDYLDRTRTIDQKIVDQTHAELQAYVLHALDVAEKS